jgi:predicted nucleotidyltransferase
VSPSCAETKTVPKFHSALEALCTRHVDFIVVGGVAAVFNGAPISTFDLDLVHSRSSANLDRLLAALTEIEAHYRDQTTRKLPPRRDLLAGDGHNLMNTKFGPIDLLGTIGKGHTFESLQPETKEITLSAFTVRVLSLPALIRIKEETAREKDRAVLAILRRTLAEQTEP